MVIDSIETLLTALRHVQILAPNQVDEVERDLGPHYENPFDLAEYLVEIDWMTGYQRRLLFEGRWDELTVGPYQILDRLGEGGVSEVFKAWDTVKGRTVALKVLRQHLTTHEEAVQQLRRELEAVILLAHPNIIKTYDADQVGGRPYFAMEYVEGMDLHHYVQKVGPLAVGQACDYIRQAAQGLQHAHQTGLVHRDVKPANLLLLNPPLLENQPAARDRSFHRPAETVVKVLDWGLARLKPQPGVANGPSAYDPEAEKGMLIGTADYISPEQAQDATLVDIRADIYSLGCALYFCLTGKPPFEGASLMQKLLQHREADPPPIQTIRPDVSDELNAVLLKMLAKKPDDRYHIPLLAAAALRRFSVPGANNLLGLPGLTTGAGFRPGSSGNLIRPGSTLNMPRPSSSASLARPASSPNLGAPRPGTNGSSRQPSPG